MPRNKAWFPEAVPSRNSGEATSLLSLLLWVLVLYSTFSRIIIIDLISLKSGPSGLIPTHSLLTCPASPWTLSPLPWLLVYQPSARAKCKEFLSRAGD